MNRLLQWFDVSWLDDRMNPIVVKDLRQAVQGRFVSAALNILLLVEVSVLTAYLLGGNINNDNLVSSQGAGNGIFRTIFGFLLFMGMVIIPLFVAPRLAMERSDGALSLLFISTLPPRRIVSGKFLANQLLILMLFVATLPFVSFTYFLRGIDLPSIFVVMVAGFVGSAVCLQVMILFACLPANKFIRLVLGLASLMGLPTAFVATNEALAEGVRNGIGSQLGTWGFWLGAAVFLGMTGSFIGLCYLMAVAVVSPPTANRAWPLRLYVSLCWLVSVAVIGVLMDLGYGGYIAEIWLVFCATVIVGALLVVISGPDQMSRRVAGSVPQAAFKRQAAFFFWSGSANGVAWVMGFTVCTTIAYIAFSALSTSSLDGLGEMIGFVGYSVAYALTALLIHRRFLKARFSAGWTWAVALVLVVAGMLLPMVVGFLIFPDTFKSDSDNIIFYFLNPFATFERNMKDMAISLGLAWAGFMLAISTSWALPQLKAFERAGAKGHDASPG